MKKFGKILGEVIWIIVWACALDYIGLGVLRFGYNKQIIVIPMDTTYRKPTINKAFVEELRSLTKGDLIEDTKSHQIACVAYTQTDTDAREEHSIGLFLMSVSEERIISIEFLAVDPVRRKIIRKTDVNWKDTMIRYLNQPAIFENTSSFLNN